MLNLDLKGQVALVTGSTQGLGAVIARELARCGAGVAVHGRSARAAGEQLVAEIKGSIYTPFDVRDADAVRDGVTQVEQKLGAIDVLITCASTFTTAQIDELDSQTWDDVLGSTLTGTFNTLAAVIPGMAARGSGRVVTFGCVGCEKTFHATNQVPYRIAASGVLSVTRAWAQRVFKDGVTVNCICPGHLENTEAPANVNILPAGKLTPLAEVLPTLRYLLSPESSAVSGAQISVAQAFNC